MAGGRPTKYRPEMCDTLAGMGSDGEGMAEAYVALKISPDTFHRWVKEIPEFSEAVKAYRARSQAWWEEMGRKGTFGLTEGFNGTGFVFNMKNRFPDDWRDKQEVDHSGKMTVAHATVEFIDAPESKSS